MKSKIAKPDKSKSITIGDGSPITATIGDNVTALPNTSVTVVCSVTGVPRPIISWTKDGQPIVLTHNVLITEDGKLLTLRSVEVKDKGLYTCTAKNSIGTDSVDTQIDIKGEPQHVVL